MLFNSYEFIFAFLPITFILYFYLLSQRLILGAKIFLVVASLFFYGYWNFSYVPLILLSIFVNYGVGLSLVNHEKIKLSSKTILIFGILFNVGLLGYFKYTDFLLENFNGIFGSNIPLPHIILPLGISFFTFTQIAFLVDAYRREAKEYSLVNYMLFVTYFPHLLAGPILHHKEMMPQFASKYNWVKNYRNIALGLFIFSIGLFKKVVIADTFAVWATAGFDTATTLNLIEAWATSLSYTFQLYFDFSGYCDMAIGISLMFNIKLPINFNSPYKALNIQDFWRRWHMTLSRFLRDYIYIPLGGNRKGNTRTYVNLLSTFLIGGLWHGAGWTFIIWGALHGIALAIHRFWQSLGFKMNKILAWFITFNFINITWIFFRAKDFESAIKVLSSMFSLDNIVIHPMFQSKLAFLSQYGISFSGMFENIQGSKEIIILLFFAFILVLAFKNSMIYLNSNFKANKKYLLLSIFLFSYAFITSVMSSSKVFLYFNF
ncbi:MBOAT family O-acyltransferase [Aliarcobacter skirrowii]|uniref:Membrane-bound O-acyltransferase family protein n=1 Tax=Aliarcobacter skirrowii TaxID=28200 RepID=A0A2U2C1W9_9BACT|nr:MBOAT family protein [Aliarcobacter skirrowii]PWE21266.1 membrane-bound O-acyltransferase family protein [Aliarcobacter skirrowii]PWE22279.1 membrane-bound O-acyltransferase family protein [Aliarcobacter skirrowii]PWE26203.1 membrane-bound O-acyltransferase family protein [Aliarcobacter skirrowii]RJO55980.1 MBOAT family protein [Aliarcobacter skirrowii]RJO58022.1 MBOAT family protein [Aliarcobacter skirrowii]